MSNRVYASLLGLCAVVLAGLIWLENVPPAKAEGDGHYVIPFRMSDWLQGEGFVLISDFRETPAGPMLPLIPMAIINGVPVSLLARADETVEITEEVEWKDETETEATTVKVWLTVCYQWDQTACRYKKLLVGYFTGHRLHGLNLQAVQLPYD